MSTTVYMDQVAQSVNNLAPDATAKAVRAALEAGAQPVEIIIEAFFIKEDISTPLTCK